MDQNSNRFKSRRNFEKKAPSKVPSRANRLSLERLSEKIGAILQPEKLFQEKRKKTSLYKQYFFLTRTKYMYSDIHKTLSRICKPVVQRGFFIFKNFAAVPIGKRTTARNVSPNAKSSVPKHNFVVRTTISV